jgi:hypothetical protein
MAPGSRLAHAARDQAKHAAGALRLRGGGLMHPDTAHRGRLLYIALGFLGLDPQVL